MIQGGEHGQHRDSVAFTASVPVVLDPYGCRWRTQAPCPLRRTTDDPHFSCVVDFALR